jgi:hypothetical protein
MAIKRMCRNAVHFREFQDDPITHVHYTATCGETALAAAMVCATPEMESKQDAINLMMSMTREMLALGWADKPKGATTTGHLNDEALRRKFKVASPYVRWQDPIPSAKLHPWLLKYAGIMPIVLMVTHAGEGLKAVDGSHAEAGVRGHFVCVVGLADEGYVTMDGDNNRIEGELPIYSWAALEKAHVTGFLMLELLDAPVPAPVPVSVGGGSMVPTGWKDDGTTLTAPNGVVVINGFRAYVLANGWAEYNEPLRPEYGDAAGSHQRFRCSQLFWSKATNVVEDNLGEQADAAEAKATALQAQIDQLNAALNAARLTNQQKNDLAVIAALRTALATHA